DFMFNGVPAPYGPERSPLDQAEAGLVYHIVTPRDGNPDPGEPAGTIHKRHSSGSALKGEAIILGGEEGEDPGARIIRRLHDFNQDWRQLRSTLAEALETSKGYVLPPKDAGRLPAHLRHLLARYAMADTLALHFQNKTWDTLLRQFWLIW